jgi:hypothetical protein
VGADKMSRRVVPTVLLAVAFPGSRHGVAQDRLGTGLLAVPVLAGRAAYAVGEALHWRVGLAQRPDRARAFYGTIAVAMIDFPMDGAPLNGCPNDNHRAGRLRGDCSQQAQRRL